MVGGGGITNVLARLSTRVSEVGCVVLKVNVGIGAVRFSRRVSRVTASLCGRNRGVSEISVVEGVLGRFRGLCLRCVGGRLGRRALSVYERRSTVVKGSICLVGNRRGRLIGYLSVGRTNGLMMQAGSGVVGRVVSKRMSVEKMGKCMWWCVEYWEVGDEAD